MTLRLGDTAPDFVANSQSGVIHFDDWVNGSWVVLFSHPKDFTPVCTTELGAVAKLSAEFKRRNVKVLGLSVDPPESHQKWIRDIEETQGATIDFPIISDADRMVARLFGMIHPKHDDTYTVRTVFIIDPKRTVRLILTYPQTTGRNFQEILRVIDSLQLTDRSSVATPADWRAGEDVIIALSVSDEEAKRRFPHGWKASKPYLRLVKQPSLN
jgi:alkyl hydroperoxide reductase subunit AhpC